MLTEVCLGESICNFREGSSSVDHNCAIESLPVSEQASVPLYMRDSDCSKNVDVQDIPEADVREGSFGSVDKEELHGANFVEGLVTEQLSDPSRTESGDFLKSVDAQHLDKADFQEGSSIKPNIARISVTQQLSDPSCSQNCKFSNSVDAYHFAESDCQEGSSGIDITPTIERISVREQLSDSSCTENDDFFKSADAKYFALADSEEGSSAFDIKPIPQKFSGSSCSENDDFFKSVDGQHVARADIEEGSSAINFNSTVERITVTQQLSDSSCPENVDFCGSADAQHLAGADLQEGSSASDTKHAVERISVDEQLSDPLSTEKDDMSKTMDAHDISGADVKGGSISMNLNSTADITLVTRQLSEPTCTKNDDLFKCVDAQDLSRADFTERLPTKDHAFTIEKLSVSRHRFEPSCVGGNDFSKGMGAHSLGDNVVSAFDSINDGGPCGQGEKGGEDTIKVDSASEANRPDSKCVPPRKRSLRNSRSRQNAETTKPVRNRRNLTNRKASLDLASFKITRQRRSCYSKRARSSVWGLLTGIQAFETTGEVDVNLGEPKKPSSIRGGQARGKGEKNQSRTCSKKSKKKGCGISGHISLKVRVGNEVVPSSMVDAFSTDNNIERHYETTGKSSDLSKEEELPRSMGFQGCKENLDRTVTCSDDSMLDFHLGGKNLVENHADKNFDDLQQFLSTNEVDKLGASIDSGGLDPGTSPDSEVINQNLDAAYMGKGLEGLPDILSSSKAFVPSEDVLSLSPIQKNNKKGKKKKKMLKAGSCSPKDELSNSEIVDNGHQFAKVEHGEKDGDVTHFAEASASATTANVSANTSSTEGMSKEPLFSRVADFGMSCVTCKAESSREMNVSSSIGNRFESSVSQKSKKVLPCSKGQKISKSAKTEGMRDSKSEVPAPANKRGSTSRKKVNRDKSVGKLKLKAKVNGGLTSGEVEGQAHTGNLKLLDHGESGSGNSSLSADVSTLEIEPGAVMEQITKARNAWVLCDDCNKWRRIPATLADQIEDANCKWTCKDNTDKNFADCSVPQEKSNAEINAELDISDASCDEDAYDARRNSDQSRKNQSTVAQQPKWRPIKTNLFLHRNKKNHTIDEIMVCHCKPPSDGRMGCGDGCLNRMLNIECVQGTCPCGELCSNQQFQKRKYAKLKCVKCGKKGHGLQVLEDISEGQFLIEYVGEVLDMHTYGARQREYALKGHKHFYFMTLSNLEVIDACAKGNLGRFINHSCEPNCRTEKWIVNGEVCIGIFALRNIKKGEEVTFDYNYVRVFGAAAKKCVCGSSQCRGYIGGDPQNAEVIVQDESDDEYPEPFMVCQDGVVDESLNVKITARSSVGLKESRTSKEPPRNMDRLNESEHIVKDLDISTQIESAGTEVAEKVETDNSATVVGPEEVVEESVDSLNKSMSAAPEVDISAEIEESVGQLQFLGRPETVLNPDDLSSINMSVDEQKCSLAERSMKRSSCSTAGLEENPPSMVSKCLPIEMDSKRKLKSGVGESRIKSSKSHPLMKISQPSSSAKKEKPKSFSVIGKRLEEMQSKFDVLSCKSKKMVDGSLSGRFEAVQEKLNELLDHDGGISKRRDSSRGYLKLLLLTAASGDSGDGETIQSNRDLSMILDALLKTKSRTVLVDIMNKNGLQMLHNMLKRYRKEFKKIPILRKLLKVFEYLATREILTSEQINAGPPCPGVESFRESILSFTEHTDKQVHQIARSFRDRWIPRASRKSSCMDWEDNKTEIHRGLDCSRVPLTHNRWSDRSGRQSETPDCITQSIVTSSTADACIVDGSCPPPSSGTRTRKRKSRWDQPEDPDPRAGSNMAGCHNIDDDAPPGFAAPLGALVVPAEASTNAHCIHPINDVKLRHETVLGHPQQRFISRLSVSYGIPLCTMQQVGTPQPGKVEGWSVAPGMPFNPFPPLPPYPLDKRDLLSDAADSAVTGHSAHVGEQDQNRSASHHSGINPPSSSRPSLQGGDKSGEKNKLNLQQSRGFNTLGRKYFRQQKWNNSKHVPPWIRNRNNWGFMGNNSRNGMYNIGLGNGTNEFRNSHGLEKVNGEMDSSAYYYHQAQPY